ncbi:unnamed protein product [Malus baccata var. baccata]
MERIHVTMRAMPLSAEDAKTSPWRIFGNSIAIPNHSKFEFGTVFAYGQTNSGKTHTIRGSATEQGVIPLAVRKECGIYVAGLREEIVASPEQVLDLMEFGESHRHIGETNMNLYSSRSHTIFRMIIESRDKHVDEDIGNSCDVVRVSVQNLVDLAGSERAAKTVAEGVRLKEGSHINKSLMTLGTVIKKLSEGAEIQGVEKSFGIDQLNNDDNTDHFLSKQSQE